MRPFFWGYDPSTGEDIPIYYDELEDDLVQSFIKPVGGFFFDANLFTLSRLPEVPFYIKDWLPKRGKAMIYGHAKAGKSYLCLQVSRCIGSGLSFLGIPTSKGKVAYTQFELGEEILQYRMRNETKQDYANVWVGTDFSMKLDTKHGQDRLWRGLDAVNPDVLILDPKIKMISGDENESHEMQKVCDFLDSVIEGFNCSILIIDHAGKDTSRRGRGSTIWEGWVDSYIEMKRTSKTGENLRVKIRPVFLRHAALPPEPIEAKLNGNFEFELVNPEPTVKDMVEEFIKKHKGEVTPKEIFAKNIGSNTSVYGALDELVKEGKIKKTGRGIYKWK